MEIYESAENYLETIYILFQKHGKVRSIDISRALRYSKPAVSVMVKQLEENGYVKRDASGHISLTNKGHRIAETIYERHMVIANLLMAIGVEEETAFADSCKIEHDISEKSFHCIKNYYLSHLK